jgi:nitronate monooxygenase
MANVGKAQIRSAGATEPALVTVGDDLNTVAQFLAPGATTYTAADVVNKLLGGVSTAAAQPAQVDTVG